MVDIKIDEKQVNEIIQQVNKEIADYINSVVEDKFGVDGELTQEQLKNNELNSIKANVNNKIAGEVLERAKYYCPVDTGRLKESGHLEPQPDGSVDVVFDCEYAWYVHEDMNKIHAFPTCAKFLTIAVEEIKKLYGLD